MAIRFKLNPLDVTTAFPYLRRMGMYNNSDWAAFYSNLRKAHRIWGMLAKVLGKTGVPIKYRVMVYNVIVQVVLLYGSKILVVEDVMMTVLEGFCHRIARRIA